MSNYISDFDTYNSRYEDPSPFVPKQTESGVNKLTGFLSKALDTALDVYTINQQTKQAKALGSVYPTGQRDPAAYQSDIDTEKKLKANTVNYTPYIIGGGALIIFAVVLVALNKKN